MKQFTLPDGTIVGTGLQMPVLGKVSTFAAYEADGPMLAESEIEKVAKSGEMDGSKKFDESWIDNQRHHGSCNGFAEAIALSKARVKRGLKRVMLSGAYAYSLINGGRDNGSQLEDGMMACMGRGVATRDTVAWNQIYRGSYDTVKADEEAKNYKGFECYAVNTWEGMTSALASGFVVVTAVHAGGGFNQVHGETGVAGVDYGSGNHAVHCDGIVWAGQLVACGVNSWGTGYGKRGRMGLTKLHYQQPAKYHMTYAMRSTSDGKDEPDDLFPDAKA